MHWCQQTYDCILNKILHKNHVLSLKLKLRVVSNLLTHKGHLMQIIDEIMN